MTINDIVTYATAIVVVLMMVAGGWVKIRDWFKAKAEEKEAAAKEVAEATEAAIQARIDAAVAAAKSST